MICRGWGLDRFFRFGPFLIAFACLFGAARRCAAEVPCGIRSVRETVAPWYPPIARAAHVSGVVVLVATFDRAGEVTEVRAVSGPMLLRVPAETFVKDWQADAYTGPRSCPVVVKYALAGGVPCAQGGTKGEAMPRTGRIDTQHFVVGGYALALCDPAATIVRRKRLSGLF